MVTYSTGWGPSSLAKLVYNYNNHSVWYANNYNITIFGRGYQPTYITGGPHPVVIWWYYIVYSIYASIGGILMGSMLPYIAAPWILWDMVTYSIYFPKKGKIPGRRVPHRPDSRHVGGLEPGKTVNFRHGKRQVGHRCSMVSDVFIALVSLMLYYIYIVFWKMFWMLPYHQTV